MSTSVYTVIYIRPGMAPNTDRDGMKILGYNSGYKVVFETTTAFVLATFEGRPPTNEFKWVAAF
jgi:hypothetical protein